MPHAIKTKPLTIGRVAAQVGVNIETVRYYQRVGLIEAPAKPEHGYRIYPSQVLDRIRFIKRAQQLGFNLREVAELLELGDGHCADVRQRAEKKRALIEQQIADLSALQQTLDTLIDACGQNNDPIHCPIVKTLAKHSEN